MVVNKPLQQFLVGRRACSVKYLMGNGRHTAVVNKTVLAHHPIGHSRSRRRCEHRADVYGHIENGERGIALAAVTRVVIKVSHHYLQVSLEKAGTHCNERQRSYHAPKADTVGLGRNCKEEVANKHYGHT